jgi:hypothetical protein
MVTEREDISEEAMAAYKRAAEAVLAAGPEDRGEVNKQIAEVIKDAKESWPTMSENDLASFFQSQSMLMTTLGHMNVMKLSMAIDLVFRNCTLAAAAIVGAYDLDDTESPKRDLDELAEEAIKANEEFNLPDSNTGMYL